MRTKLTILLSLLFIANLNYGQMSSARKLLLSQSEGEAQSTVEYIGAVTSNNTTSVGSPNGILSGDLIVIVAYTEPSSGIVAPANYQILRYSTNDGIYPTIGIYYKTADASDIGATTNITIPGTSKRIIKMAFRNTAGITGGASAWNQGFNDTELGIFKINSQPKSLLVAVGAGYAANPISDIDVIGDGWTTIGGVVNSVLAIRERYQYTLTGGQTPLLFYNFSIPVNSRGKIIEILSN